MIGEQNYLSACSRQPKDMHLAPVSRLFLLCYVKSAGFQKIHIDIQMICTNTNDLYKTVGYKELFFVIYC